MEPPEDIVRFLETAISSWLGTNWKSLKSCPSKSGGGRFKKAHELIDRCDRLPPPPLALWCETLPPLKWTAKDKKSGQKTWCLLCDRKQAVAPAGEVALERKLVEPANEGWWAQVPTASGFNVRGATKRSIDLVQQIRDREFCFIELKVNPRTNNPIYAAIELIEYGIFYWLIRTNPVLRDKLHPDSEKLLNASAVEFAVFAPRNYYKASVLTDDHEKKLLKFGEKISDAFEHLGGNRVRMTFAFRLFDETQSLRQAFKEANKIGN